MASEQSSSDPLLEEKGLIRKNVLTIRNSLSLSSRLEKSETIAKKLEKTEAFKKAGHVLFYYTLGSEVNTLPLIEKYLGKKTIYLPKLISNDHFIAVPLLDMKSLGKNRYGIPEPLGEKEAAEIDCIILPGSAFDRLGNRLGMGKGYYDRFLRRFPKAKKIALAFEEQMLDRVPKEKYDVPVDLIITDRRTYP